MSRKSLKFIENGTVHRSHMAISFIQVSASSLWIQLRTQLGLHLFYAGIAELITGMFYEIKRNIGRNTPIFNNPSST